MSPIRAHLVAQIRAKWDCAVTQQGKLCLLGELAAVLSSELEPELKLNGQLGWPCPMMMARARCLSHA